MQLTLSKQLGEDLLEEAERRGQSVDEYVSSLSRALHGGSSSPQSAQSSQPVELSITDEDAQMLLAVAQMENILPPSWIQSWRDTHDEAKTKIILGGIIALAVLLAMPEGHAQLSQMLQRFATVARLTREAELTQPVGPPAWLADIKPRNPPTDGTNGLHRVIGAWPGDETDEEIQEMLERLS